MNCLRLIVLYYFEGSLLISQIVFEDYRQTFDEYIPLSR